MQYRLHWHPNLTFEHELVLRGDDTCELAARIALAFAKTRVRWGMFFIRGWPTKLLDVLANEDRLSETTQLLERDYEHVGKLGDLLASDFAQELKKRRVFQSTLALQVYKAYLDKGNCIDEEFRAFLRDDLRRCWGSQ